MSVLELPPQSWGGPRGGYVITATYVGDERAVVESSGGRTFVVDQRTKIEREGAQFCPVELIATSLGA
jgi:uncharacterized OsmC-like protein